MANKICYPLIKVEERDVEKVKVPTGVTLTAGDVILCETLDTTSTDNREVYLGEQVSDITTEVPCMVINQGFFQLSNGQRPDGNPNPAKFEYGEGEIVTVIRMRNDLKFFISDDCLDNTGVVAPAAGVHLIAQNNDYQLATIAALAGTEACGLKIEKTENMAIGGNFGLGFASGSITRVVKGR